MFEELVREIRERSVFMFPHHGGHTSYDADLLHRAADAIEELSKDRDKWKATAQEERDAYRHWFDQYQKDVPRWIPVSERLPEDLTVVLAVEEGTVFLAHCEHYYGEEEVFVEWHDIMYYPVSPTHWMPLPSAPTEE